MKKVFPIFVLVCIGLVVVGTKSSRRETTAVKPAASEATPSPIYARAR